MSRLPTTACMVEAHAFALTMMSAANLIAFSSSQFTLKPRRACPDYGLGRCLAMDATLLLCMLETSVLRHLRYPTVLSGQSNSFGRAAFFGRKDLKTVPDSSLLNIALKSL
jgi:hypothetical protein